jgi:hypothetical protein
MVFATIALPLVSPLVAEAIVAACASVAGLMEPGVLKGEESTAADKVLEVLEDNAKLVDNLSPYVFSVLCRADAAAASGFSDASTRRTQAAMSGACAWILAALCRALGYNRLTADALWAWANGDALWVAVLVKSILSLEQLIVAAPDTPLQGALVPSDLSQLQDVVAGAFFGLVGCSVAFAKEVAVLEASDIIDEVIAPNVQFSKHWAKLAVAVSESNLIEPVLRAVEGPASGRRIEMASFFSRLLQQELVKEPSWTTAFPTAPLIVEAARGAANSIRESLSSHRNRFWALLASVPSSCRTPRSFIKDCCELSYLMSDAMDECRYLVRNCLVDGSMVACSYAEIGALAALSVFATNAGLVSSGDDGGLSATLLSLPPDCQNSIASRLAEWVGPVCHHAQISLIALLHGTQQPLCIWPDAEGIAPRMPLAPEYCKALGMGGLKALFTGAPPELCCALDGQLFTNPMRSPYGHAFEHSVLASMLAENGQRCPMTGQPLCLESCQHDWGLKRQSDHRISMWAQKASKSKC